MTLQRHAWMSTALGAYGGDPVSYGVTDMCASSSCALRSSRGAFLWPAGGQVMVCVQVGIGRKGCAWMGISVVIARPGARLYWAIYGALGKRGWPPGALACCSSSEADTPARNACVRTLSLGLLSLTVCVSACFYVARSAPRHTCPRCVVQSQALRLAGGLP